MRKTMMISAVLCMGLLTAAAPPPPSPLDPILAPGDFDAAARAYSATLVKTPSDAAALAGLARIRLYQERRADARKLAEQALAADAGNSLAKRVLTSLAIREAMSNNYKIDMPKGGVTIPFEATDPLPVLKLRIAGHDVFFVLDTGGADLTLDTAFAAELGLTTTAAGQGVFAGGQQAPVGHTVLPQAQIGSITMANIAVTVLPTRNFELKPGLRIDGVIGTGFLMHFLSTIDYVHGALILKPRSDSAAFERRAKGAVPMWLVGDHFLFARGHINNGPEGLFNIDTGLAGGGLQGTKPVLDAAGVVLDESKATTGEGGGGTVRFIPFKASATLGNLTVRDVQGVYTPDGDQFGLFPFPISGTLSHAFFRAHALTLDFDAMKIVVR